jgi:hypothetical protein
VSGEEQHAAIRGEVTSVEGGGDFFGAQGWQGEGQETIVGRGARRNLSGVLIVFGDRFVHRSIRLWCVCQRIAAMRVNKTS